MRKKLTAVSFISAMSTQACAPYDYAEQPTAAEAERIEGAIGHYNFALPLAMALAKKSKVPMLDAYGNYDETGNKQVAADLKEKNELLNWFYVNDRILLYDLADYQGDSEPAGMYDSNLGQQHKNDWIYVERDYIGAATVYAHEIAHLFFAGPDHGHSHTVYDYVNDDENEAEFKSDEGALLQYAIKQQDPAYQDGEYIQEVWDFFWNINPYDEMRYNIEDVIAEVDHENLTPQQGYDRLYKEFQNMEKYYSASIPGAMFDDDGNNHEYYGLWPLELEVNDVLEAVLECPEMRAWYNEVLIPGVLENEYLSQFSEGEIETWEERQASEAQDKRVVDLNRHRINKTRLR